MKIEIITTGDEVMQGVIVDTNTAWIAERCWAFGFEIVRHTSIGDDANAIADALKQAAKRADVVMVTGGLGPTADDITLETAAKAFGKKLIRNEGAAVLENRVGTAPGIRVKLGAAEFFFLPGVPKELYQIFEDSVMPWLKEHAQATYAVRVLRCFGIPEASIDTKLSSIELGEARLSFRVKFPEILLKLVARGKDPIKAQKAVDDAAHNIMNKLGDVVYGQGEATLAEVVGTLLKQKGFTLSVAESCTGGLMCSMITDVPGASDYFERGAVCYSNLSKQQMLGVPGKVIESEGAVSKDTVISMAEGIRRESKTDIGVGITGIAGPSGGTPNKPVGTVHIALATPDGTWAREYHYERDRLWFKQIVAATALDMVRKYLLKSEL
ncbi:MAG: nicotinamide-nucleotide amidohydrolase family protein [Pseudomonadota bacterium]